MSEKKCNGLFGKLFGHKFRRYCVKEVFRMPYTTCQITGNESIMRFFENQQDDYIIMCERCGLNAKGQNDLTKTKSNN